MDKKYFCKRNPIVGKIFMTMLIPTILMNLTTALASFADTIIIGYFLDDLALSVVTFATPIYMIINTFGALYAVGGSIAMGIDSGKGDKKAANKVFSISVELIVLTGLILVVLGIFFGEQITTLLGAGADVFDMVYTYSMIVLIGAPVFMLNIALAFFVRNDGRPNLSMIGMFLSIAVNIVFDIIFIGVFDMGVAGAAYATVLGQLVSALVIAGHFFTKKNTLRFSFAADGNIIRIIRNGVSTALHFVYQFLSILILNHLVVALAGTDGVVVYTVVFNLYSLSLALFEGLSQTIQPMISVYYGEKSNRKIKNTLFHAFVATIVLCGSVTLVLELVPQIIPHIFGISDGAIMTQAAMAVRTYATSMIIMTINVIIGYYLQSIEVNSMAAVLVSLRCCILFLGSAFALGAVFGMNGIWAAYTLAEVLTFIVFIFMTVSKRRKLRKAGVDLDVFLLDRNIENNTSCYTVSADEEITEFVEHVSAELEENSMVSKAVCEDAKAYLECIKGFSKGKKGYADVEVIGTDGKVIIRDNFIHSFCGTEIEDKLNNGSRKEYGAVLGWNRICLEGGDYEE